MSWDVASIYPHNFPTSWCHLFCEVHQSLLQQSTPITWCCHPRASRLGWCSSACKHPPFSSKHKDGHYGQKVLFLFHQTRGHFFQKVWSLSPCANANRSMDFLWWFWSSGLFLAEWPFRLCRYRTCFTVDIDTVVPVFSSIFTRYFPVVLGLICTFRTKETERVSFLSGMTAAWSHGVYTCKQLMNRWTDEHGTFRHLEIAPKDEPDLWRSTIFFWGLGWFLFIFPWC